MQRLHRWVGIVTVVVFLLTGLYMRWRFPGLYETDETIRYLFRANHIYLCSRACSTSGSACTSPSLPSAGGGGCNRWARP